MFHCCTTAVVSPTSMVFFFYCPSKLPLIGNVSPNIVTNISPNIALDVYPDVGCCVSNIASNLSIGNISPVYTHLLSSSGGLTDAHRPSWRSQVFIVAPYFFAHSAPGAHFLPTPTVLLESGLIRQHVSDLTPLGGNQKITGDNEFEHESTTT